MEISDFITILTAVLGSGGATYVTLKVKSAVNETKIKYLEDQLKSKASKSDIAHIEEDVKELKGTKGNVYENIGDLTKSITEMTTIMKENGKASGKAHKDLRDDMGKMDRKIDKINDEVVEVKTDVAILKNGNHKKK